MEHGTWNMEHGTWNMEHGTWNMEHGIWNMEHGIWNEEWRMKNEEDTWKPSPVRIVNSVGVAVMKASITWSFKKITNNKCVVRWAWGVSTLTIRWRVISRFSSSPLSPFSGLCVSVVNALCTWTARLVPFLLPPILQEHKQQWRYVHQAIISQLICKGPNPSLCSTLQQTNTQWLALGTISNWPPLCPLLLSTS